MHLGLDDHYPTKIAKNRVCGLYSWVCIEHAYCQGVGLVRCAYIGDLLYDKMFGSSVPVAGQHVLVLSLGIPHKVVSRLLAFALS